MPNTLEVSQIRQNLRDTIDASEITENDFLSLAIDIFHYQFTKNAAYQNYCKLIGAYPEKVQHWHDIPLVSTDSFKLADYPLCTNDIEDVEHTFWTSGTTTDIRGKHYFPSVDLYKKSILKSWKQLSLNAPEAVVFLTPRPEHAPNSSLSHMMSVIAKHYANAEIIWTISEQGDMELDKIAKLAERKKPVALFGTAIAYLHLFENCQCHLPEGSFAMETGGYKGTKRQMEKEDLYALFKERLALPPESVINEYSMTELSSQFYTRGLGNPHHGPAWVKTRVIDPLTGRDAKSGQPGHLAIYDLANIYSVCALQTQDLAIAEKNGGFTLLGRDPSALPRGCSRAADHALM